MAKRAIGPDKPKIVQVSLAIPNALFPLRGDPRNVLRVDGVSPPVPKRLGLAQAAEFTPGIVGEGTLSLRIGLKNTNRCLMREGSKRGPAKEQLSAGP